MSDDKLRIDKWLWYARFFKSRRLAAEAVEAGVRVDGTRVSKPSRTVQPGDTLTFSQGRQVRVVRVLALGTRRGPAPEAQALYEDHSPPPETRRAPVQTGARPTKRDRRAIDTFKADDHRP